VSRDGTAAGRQRGSTPADLDNSPVPWTAVSAAVGLLTRRNRKACPDVSRADIIGEQDSGEVLAALETIAAGLLCAICPDDEGARILQGLGQLAAEGRTGDPPDGPR
jgi:hypothetical protein